MSRVSDDLNSPTFFVLAVPTFFAILIQVWKVYKATGLSISWSSYYCPAIVLQRWADDPVDDSGAVELSPAEAQLTKVTLEADR